MLRHQSGFRKGPDAGGVTGGTGLDISSANGPFKVYKIMLKTIISVAAGVMIRFYFSPVVCKDSTCYMVWRQVICKHARCLIFVLYVNTTFQSSDEHWRPEEAHKHVWTLNSCPDYINTSAASFIMCSCRKKKDFIHFWGFFPPFRRMCFTVERHTNESESFNFHDGTNVPAAR